jgi:hypothetical protein
MTGGALARILAGQWARSNTNLVGLAPPPPPASATGYALSVMHRPVPGLAVLLAAVLVLGGCNTGPPVAGSPDQAVRLVFDELNQGDLEGMLSLACEAQQATLREQFGFAGLGSTMGLDLSGLLEALTIDTSRMTVTTTGIQGDGATVQLAGAMGLSIDAARLRELFRQIAQSEGVAVDDARLEQIVTGLQTMTQAIPINETVEVVREDGTWKLCSRLTLVE